MNKRTGCVQRPWCCVAFGLSLLSAGCAPPPVVYQGYVEGQFAYLAAPLSGHVRQLSVARGTRVASGTPLFSVDSPDATYSAQRQYHEWQSSRDQLADLRHGKRASEIESIEAQLGQARTAAARAASRLARAQADYKVQAISLERLEAERASAQAESARVRDYAAQLKTARLPARDDQLRAQREAVAARQAEYERSEQILSQMNVGATERGLVVDTFYTPGEWVSAGAPVVKLLPDHGVKVRFFVPETRLAGLRAGMTVSVNCDGCKTPYRATIRYVSPEAEYTPPAIYSDASRSKLVFLVEAEFDRATHDVPPVGLPVRVAL